MLDDLPFLRALYNRPDDDGLRLIYADWLDDRGDPRAEFLRRDVKLRREASAENRKPALEERFEVGRTFNTRWGRHMDLTRDLSPGDRLDLAVVADGKGLIDVRGGEGETVLLLEGRPIALNWDDCHGSIGQYLVFTGHTRGADCARQMAELVEGGVDARRPLADQIEPLLAVFVPGIYCLRYTPSAPTIGFRTFDYTRPSVANRELVNYYPYPEEHVFVCTQMTETLNEDRVAYFRDRIRTGRRPIVLTASAEDAWCEFVIDGHHKLAAYNREKVNPSVLAIIRWQSPDIRVADGLSYFPVGHPGVAEYRRVKELFTRSGP